jgi:hemoglobin
MPTLYEHAGGEEALHRLEEIFYTKVLSDPMLKALFTERRPHHVDHLTWFTAESFGGPDRFTRELGFQYIIDAHRHLKISDEQRDRFVTLYMEALDEAPRRRALPAGGALTCGVWFACRPAEFLGRDRCRPSPHPQRSAVAMARKLELKGAPSGVRRGHCRAGWRAGASSSGSGQRLQDPPPNTPMA